MVYTVVDLETTVRSPISMPAHPMWPDNQIVMAGLLHQSDVGRETYVSVEMVDREGYIIEENLRSTLVAFARIAKGRLVGHNLKFDLLYLMEKGWLTPANLVREHTIWDTQLAEYLLTGQQSSYASLDDVSVKYGGVLKDDRIKELWESGVQTERIPTGLLSEYLLGDITNTEIVYLAQVELAKKFDMLPLIESQMRALMATTIMEYNGMKVDRKYIEAQSAVLAKKIEETEALLSSIPIPSGMPVDWQWSSGKDVSMLLFGGTYTVKEKHHVGHYKNGKDKYKLVDVERSCAGLGFEPSSVGANPTKTGNYTVDETVLKNCDHLIAQTILNLRTLSKQRETYYENMRSLTFPSGFIHPNLNHVTTKTGRLSCNKPNIQNQTIEGGIKKAYVSRWREQGRLVDFDYSQLEMAGLAAIANDEQLAYDINHGIDMHTELFKEMYGRTCTKDERKKFKPLSFGLVYGAGAKTLAANAGCTVAEARKFIKVFYGRYKGVAKFHSTIMDDAMADRKLTTKRSPKGLPVGIYTKRMSTGRIYVFGEYDNDWKGGVSFSPTELKNWPVQGFATGDVVPHMVGLIVEKLYKTDMYNWCIPIMTVHDSIVFDVHEEYVDKFIKACYSVLKNTTAFINHYFNIEMPVTLSVGCSVGKNWQDLEEVELSKYD